mgnify:CR=1 FL=1
MPLVMRTLGRSMPSYTYLPESIRTFPLPDELSATLERLGFTDVTYRRLTNGISVVHVGTKIGKADRKPPAHRSFSASRTL